MGIKSDHRIECNKRNVHEVNPTLLVPSIRYRYHRPTYPIDDREQSLLFPITSPASMERDDKQEKRADLTSITYVSDPRFHGPPIQTLDTGNGADPIVGFAFFT